MKNRVCACYELGMFVRVFGSVKVIQNQPLAIDI